MMETTRSSGTASTRGGIRYFDYLQRPGGAPRERMDIRFKQHPPVGGDGQWTHAPLQEFLLGLPYLFLPPSLTQPIPPLAVLNDVCRSGKLDAGMSGACEWKAFEIPRDEYDELVRTLAAHPEYRFVNDIELAGITSRQKWHSKVLSKYSAAAQARRRT